MMAEVYVAVFSVYNRRRINHTTNRREIEET